MGTQSFYIPDNIESFIGQQLDTLARKNRQSRSELITTIIQNHLKTHPNKNTPKSEWANAFCGAWKTSGPPKKLVKFIEKKRTRFKTTPFK